LIEVCASGFTFEDDAVSSHGKKDEMPKGIKTSRIIGKSVYFLKFFERGAAAFGNE